MLFMGAFALGALLWCLWMWHIVQKTRETRDSGFFVPMAGQTPPSTPANSGVTNAK
jgi:hypothetical protein